MGLLVVARLRWADSGCTFQINKIHCKNLKNGSLFDQFLCCKYENYTINFESMDIDTIIWDIVNPTRLGWKFKFQSVFGLELDDKFVFYTQNYNVGK